MSGAVPIELWWGVGLRLLALVYLIAFYSLYRDLPGLAGPRGIYPVADLVASLRRDYGWRRFFYAPSLLHIASSWRAQQLLLALGAGSAVLALVGAPYSALWFLIAWATFLSFDLAVDLLYPWDALLLEAGVLAVFAPPLLGLPAFGVQEAPHPVLSFAFRFLAFRIVFGFGKFKFFGPGRFASGYLKQFLVTQPLPRPLALVVTRLPLWMHQTALAGLFLVEVVLPWLWLGPVRYRCVPSLAAGGLMLAIQLTGNFGFFNVAMLPVLILAATPQPSAFDLPPGGTAFSLDTAHLLGVALIALALLHFPFNSWIARSWMYWPALDRIGRGVLRPLLFVVRALAPFRLVHAYGVFSPLSGPSLQWVPRFEASCDGIHFAPYRYRYYPSDLAFRGVRVAPLFPRFDHSIIYESMGLGLGNFFGCVVGGGRPHRASRSLYFERVQRRLLEASPEVLALFAQAPLGSARPAAVRVRFQMHLWDGQRFTAQTAGDHLPCATLATCEPLTLPVPETFLFDERVWTYRALGVLDPHTELRAPAAHQLFAFLEKIGAEDQLRSAGAGHVEGVAPGLNQLVPRDVLLDFAEQHRAALREHEPTVFRLAWLLRARSAPLPTEGEFELGLRCLRIALAGRHALESALVAPPAALSSFSLDAAICAFALVRPSWIRFHARKAALRAVTIRENAARAPSFAPGILRVNARLAELFPDHSVALPTFHADRTRGFVFSSPTLSPQQTA